MAAFAGLSAWSAAVLRVWGEERAIQPDAAVSAAAAAANFADHLEIHPLRLSSCSSWTRARAAVATKRSPLSIVVLGGSVTAGCGAAYPLKTCDSLSSWTRQLHDKLAAMLGGSQHVELDVWGKNAIRCTYFTQCTSHKVPTTADVVLLDLQPNLWFAGQTACPRCAQSLTELVQYVRRAAPRAAILFVGWPILRNPRTIEHTVSDVARAQHFDAWFASSWVGLARRNYTNGESLHADTVHPSRLGHAMLAVGVARLLQERLNENLPCDDNASTIVAPPPLPQSSQEWCYLSAEQLPVPVNGSAWPTIGSIVSGWSLVDEGGAKGIKKLGFLSASHDDVLRLGPLPQCAHLAASVGYLQSWRQEFGALRISCVGSCSCSPPSQVVQTSATRVGYEGGKRELENATITSSMAVGVSHHLRGQCFLQLTHVMPRKPPAPLGGRTRVRVDSLALRSSSRGCTFDSKK